MIRARLLISMSFLAFGASLAAQPATLPAATAEQATTEQDGGLTGSVSARTADQPGK